MEYERFDLTGEGPLYEKEAVALDKLLNVETVKIKKIIITAKDHVYVFYDAKENALEQESEWLQELREIAKDAKTDTVFGKLTNAKQRSLYICGSYHISKRDAEDVMELVKILEAEAEVAAEAKAKVGAEKKKRQKELEQERKDNERKELIK